VAVTFRVKYGTPDAAPGAAPIAARKEHVASDLPK
jgi:hypothetical protein